MRYFQNKLKDFLPGHQTAQIPTAALQERVKTNTSLICQNLAPDQRNCDGGLYVGIAGISYALWYASNSGHFEGDKHELLLRAKQYLDVADVYEQQQQHKMMRQSFLLGTAGVCCIGALVNGSLGDAAKSENYVKRYN